MNNSCHDISITVRQGDDLLEEELEAGSSSLDRIKTCISEGTLVTLGAVYGDEERVIDLSCENGRASIVIVEVATGVSYTYLNPRYAGAFEAVQATGSIFLCRDMEAFQRDGRNQQALAEVEIGGADCPALHVCEDKDSLLKIISCFLDSGAICPDVDWLMS